MKKKPDYGIREQKEEMLRNLKKIQSRYRDLDDAQYILTRNPIEIREAIDNYIKEVADELSDFYTSEEMLNVSKQAHQDFIRALKDYRNFINVQEELSETITEGIISSINQNIEGLVSGTQSNLLAKTIAMRQTTEEALKELEIKTLAKLNSTEENIKTLALNTFNPEYKDLTKEQIDVITQKWDEMTSRYGLTDTVRYRDGTNYPLRTYLDGRSSTTANDIYRATVSADSIASGVHTGIISTHSNCCDTCLKWQGKLVFFTEDGRNQMATTNPNLAKVPTVAELEANSDHIFGFNCLHFVTVYPIQFFSEEQRDKAIQQAA